MNRPKDYDEALDKVREMALYLDNAGEFLRDVELHKLSVIVSAAADNAKLRTTFYNNVKGGKYGAANQVRGLLAGIQDHDDYEGGLFDGTGKLKDGITIERVAQWLVDAVCSLAWLHADAKLAPPFGVGRWDSDYPRAVELVHEEIAGRFKEVRVDIRGVLEDALISLGCEEKRAENLARR